MYQDNLESIRWIENVQGLQKVRHISINYQSVRDAVNRSIERILYTPTAENQANTFTTVSAAKQYHVLNALAWPIIELDEVFEKAGLRKCYIDVALHLSVDSVDIPTTNPISNDNVV